MAKTIASTLTVTNEMDVRGRAMLDLIGTYIPGFVGRYYGFRQIGSMEKPVSFPALFIEPVSEDAKMVTTGKYEIRIVYNIYFFVIDNSSEDVLTMITSAAESLAKLFSNNALGDLGSGNTNKFKAYSVGSTVYWLDSEMTPIEISRSFIDAVPNNQGKFMRAGMLRFEIQDVIIK